MGAGNRLAAGFEAVTDSAQGFQIARMTGIAFDFFAQPADENVDRARSDEGPFFPDGIKQLVAGEDASAVAGEIFEQAELADCGEHGFVRRRAWSWKRCRSRDLPDLDLLLKLRFGLNAENVANARDEFAGAEGLGDVTVASDVEGLEAVGFLSFGGKKNDRSLGEAFVLPDLAAEIESVDAGQHDIQKKERRPSESGLRKDGRSGEKRGNFVTGGAQVVFDELGDVGIVFDDVNQIGIMRL